MNCKLCSKINITQSVTYTAPNLVLNVPQTSFNDNTTYCLVCAQNIPSTATVDAPCVVTIGDGTEQYPIIKSDGTPLTASNIHSRTKYKVCCETTPTSAVFRLCTNCLCGNNNLASVSGGTTTTVTSGSGS